MFCHVVGEVWRHVDGGGTTQASVESFVAAVNRTAAAKRADFPTFPHVSGDSTWAVLQVLEVDIFISKK